METSTSETHLLEWPFVCGLKMIWASGQGHAIRWRPGLILTLHFTSWDLRIPWNDCHSHEQWEFPSRETGRHRTVGAQRHLRVVGRSPSWWPNDSAFRDLKYHCGCDYLLPSMTHWWWLVPPWKTVLRVRELTHAPALKGLKKPTWCSLWWSQRRRPLMKTSRVQAPNPYTRALSKL